MKSASAPFALPIGDQFVYRTRVTEVVCAGQDQHGLAAKLAEIHDAQLAAGNIAPFQQQPCRDRIERRGYKRTISQLS